MRIGVNALYLIPGGVGGTEIYLRSLLDALAGVDRKNQYLLITNLETGSRLGPSAPNFSVLSQPVRARLRPLRLLWEQLWLPAVALQYRLDVLFNPGFTAPALVPCPSVTVFHDLQHKRHPEYFRWFDLPFWRLFLYQSARTSTALVAVSEATRRDLEIFYPWARGKIHVIPHGVDPRCFQIARERRDGNPAPSATQATSQTGRTGDQRLILCVSTLHPHKNIPALIRAFARLQPQRSPYRLVVAGMFGFDTDRVLKEIENRGVQSLVRLTGWISRDELYSYYRQAWACIYPTRFEGFGLPVLEALAAGIPTACSDIEPLRTLVGDAALLFNPENEEAIYKALCAIAEDAALRKELAERGPEQAKRYSWEEAARKTLHLFATVAG